MAHAEVCPICHGTGKVKKPEITSAGDLNTCHGCGGTGWVTIQDSDNPTYLPYINTVGEEGK